MTGDFLPAQHRETQRKKKCKAPAAEALPAAKRRRQQGRTQPAGEQAHESLAHAAVNTPQASAALASSGQHRITCHMPGQHLATMEESAVGAGGQAASAAILAAERHDSPSDGLLDLVEGCQSSSTHQHAEQPIMPVGRVVRVRQVACPEATASSAAAAHSTLGAKQARAAASLAAHAPAPALARHRRRAVLLALLSLVQRLGETEVARLLQPRGILALAQLLLPPALSAALARASSEGSPRAIQRAVLPTLPPAALEPHAVDSAASSAPCYPPPCPTCHLEPTPCAPCNIRALIRRIAQARAAGAF